MRFAALDLGQLGQVIWVSLGAGVGITIAYSLVVLGGARSAEARRAGRTVAAGAFATLAGLALCVFFAGVIYGVHIMLSKG
jgi:hypothetical protein